MKRLTITLALVALACPAVAHAHRPPLKTANAFGMRVLENECKRVYVRQIGKCTSFGVGRQYYIAAGHYHATGAWVWPLAHIYGTKGAYEIKLRITYMAGTTRLVAAKDRVRRIR